MNVQEASLEAKKYAGKSREELRSLWKEAQARSGKSSRDFSYNVQTLKNVADGRCPDGCCGNEERTPWKPTPAEWVVLAEHESRSLAAPPAPRTSPRPARTGSRRW